MTSNRVNLADIEMMKEDSSKGSVKAPVSVQVYRDTDGTKTANFDFDCPDRFFLRSGNVARINIIAGVDEDNRIDFDRVKQEAKDTCFNMDIPGLRQEFKQRRFWK